MNTNYRGDFSELLVMASAISAGHAVARVYGNSKPFDLLVEMADGTWIRVQVKTVLMRRKNKFIPCQRSKSVTRVKRDRRYSSGAFDILAGVDEKGEVRLIQLGHLGGRTQVDWNDSRLTSVWDRLL